MNRFEIARVVECAKQSAEKVFLWWRGVFEDVLRDVIPFLLEGEWWQVALKVSGALGILSLFIRFSLGHLLDEDNHIMKHVKFVVLGPIIAFVFYGVLGFILPIVVIFVYLLVAGP